MGLVLGEIFRRESRGKKSERKDRKTTEAQLSKARRQQQELRASGPQSSLRRAGLPVVSGGVGTSLLSQQTLAPPFAQRRS